MDERVKLIADWLEDSFSVTELSVIYGVSRKTVYNRNTSRADTPRQPAGERAPREDAQNTKRRDCQAARRQHEQSASAV